MTLRVIRASDPIPVEQIVLTDYGAPGIGKTSLAFTADAPILFDFDQGAYRSANRGDSVSVKAWSDIAGLKAEDFAPYKTVIVDTVGRALDALAQDIIARDPKMGRSGALTLQGFGRLKAEFAGWLKLVRSFGLDVVLLAHVEEQKNGDDLIERIDAQGSSKNEIYKCSDAMGRLTLRSGKRVLLFSPTDTTFGKNPANFDALPVPQFTPQSRFLGDVIRTIKARLNEMTAEQTETSALLAEWHKRVEKATGAKSLTALIAESNELDPRIRDNGKRLLVSTAKDRGFDFDMLKKVFIEKQAEKVSA